MNKIIILTVAALLMLSAGNAMALDGKHVGTRCQGKDANGDSFDWPCSSIQEGQMVNCTAGTDKCTWGTSAGETTSGGLTPGTAQRPLSAAPLQPQTPTPPFVKGDATKVK